MIAVLQRVTSGKVTIDDTIVGEISHGLVILLGVMGDDEQGDNDFLVNKITDLRIFNDEKDRKSVV